MWKKPVSIVSLILSGILFIVYIANWVTDDPRAIYEVTISIQRNYISNLKTYIDECEDAIDEVEDYEWTYGSNYLTRALIDDYEDLIDEAEDKIADAREKIYDAQKEIDTINTVSGLVLFAAIACLAVGIVFLIIVIVKRRKAANRAALEALNEEVNEETIEVVSEESWTCPSCGKNNSPFFKVCECGYIKGN